MELKSCLQQIQSFLENSPLIVLGSGASAEYGLPLMGELSEEIKRHSNKFDADEFEQLCRNLILMNLEEAIDETELSDVSFNTLRRIVWNYINEKDLLQLQKLIQAKTDFALVELLKIIIRSTPNIVNVVTTNYDRLVEYAADLIGASIVTGFEGNLIREMLLPTAALHQKRLRVRERVVNLWKVHGSLDWFVKDESSIVSYPLSKEIPQNHSPLIIAPGKVKYNLTHNEPYRDIITQADTAFSNAGSFLCVGYGFNDDHIQPKLIAQIKSGKPTVALCRTATEACNKNLVSADVKKYVLIEHSSDGKTSVTGFGYKETYDGDFWKLSEFVKTVWG